MRFRKCLQKYRPEPLGLHDAFHSHRRFASQPPLDRPDVRVCPLGNILGAAIRQDHCGAERGGQNHHRCRLASADTWCHYSSSHALRGLTAFFSARGVDDSRNSRRLWCIAFAAQQPTERHLEKVGNLFDSAQRRVFDAARLDEPRMTSRKTSEVVELPIGERRSDHLAEPAESTPIEHAYLSSRDEQSSQGDSLSTFVVSQAHHLRVQTLEARLNWIVENRKWVKSLRHLATEAGVSHSTLTAAIRRERTTGTANLNSDTLIKVCRYAKVDPDWLADGTGYPDSKASRVTESTLETAGQELIDEGEATPDEVGAAIAVFVATGKVPVGAAARAELLKLVRDLRRGTLATVGISGRDLRLEPDPVYPSRAIAVMFARALRFSREAIDEIRKESNFPADPGFFYWFGRLRGRSGKLSTSSTPPPARRRKRR